MLPVFRREVGDHSPGEESQGKKSRMEAEWREQVRTGSSPLKRRAEGYADEAFIEEPLRSEQQDAIMTTYFTKYFIRSLSPKRIISDGLLGRIKREFERWAPTLLLD